MSTFLKFLRSIGLWLSFIISYWIAWYIVAIISVRWILLWVLNTVTSLTVTQFLKSAFNGDLIIFLLILTALYFGIQFITEYIFKLCPNHKIGASIILGAIIIRALLIFMRPTVQWQYVIIDNSTAILLIIPLVRVISKPKPIIHDWKPSKELIDSLNENDKY